jgi:hypothetical protein
MRALPSRLMALVPKIMAASSEEMSKERSWYQSYFFYHSLLDASHRCRHKLKTFQRHIFGIFSTSRLWSTHIQFIWSDWVSKISAALYRTYFWANSRYIFLKCNFWSKILTNQCVHMSLAFSFVSPKWNLCSVIWKIPSRNKTEKGLYSRLRG